MTAAIIFQLININNHGPRKYWYVVILDLNIRLKKKISLINLVPLLVNIPGVTENQGKEYHLHYYS